MGIRTPLAAAVGSLFLIAFQCQKYSFPRYDEITAEEYLNHVKILASDEFEGRRAGTRGARMAAEYIEQEFKRHGLRHAGGTRSYFQEFEFTADLELGPANALSLAADNDSTLLRLRDDFMPLYFSEDGSVSAEAVFVGYGISAPDLNYDDYDGVDVEGKVVIALRFSPEGSDPHSELNRYSSFRRKAMTAREKGAKAIIFITGPLDIDEGEDDTPVRLRVDYVGGRGGIIAVTARSEVAEFLLKQMEITLREVQEFLNSEKRPKSFVLSGSKVAVSTELIEINATTANVVGFLEGNDPHLKDEVVVIGAHYDHLGFGGQGSLVPDTVAIHNGADDNASGTAGLLELAQWFAAHKSDLKRSILFIAFGAEEEGLRGSAHYVKHPIVPIEQTIGMINLDMIGRLQDSVLIVGGTGSSPLWEDLVRSASGAEHFRLKLTEEGYGPSDHASFYGVDVPVLFFFTNLHGDYHRPTDDWQGIRAEDAHRVVRFVKAIGLSLANRGERPLFTKAERVPPPTGDNVGRLRAYVGTIPDFSESGAGYKIGGVTPGSPADKAGMKTGDLMVRFGGKEIRNIYDYTYALQDFKPGDEVEVQVMRADERLTMKVTLGRRSQ